MRKWKKTQEYVGAKKERQQNKQNNKTTREDKSEGSGER